MAHIKSTIKIVLVLFLVTRIQVIHGQHVEVDSLLKRLTQTSEPFQKVDIYNTLAELTWHSNTDKAMEYTDSAASIVRNLDYPKGEVFSLNNLGIKEYTLGNYQLAEKYYKQSMVLDQDMNYQSNVELYLINLYRKQGRFNEARKLITSVEENQSHYLKENDLFISNAAQTYMQIGDLNHLLIYVDKLKQRVNQNFDASNKSYYYELLASIEKLRNNEDSAIYYYQEAIRTYNQQQDILGLASSKLRLGEIYLNQNSINQAKVLYDSALSIYQFSDYPYGIAQSKFQLGKLMTRIYENRQALELFKEAQLIFQGQENINEVVEVYNEIAWLHLNQGMHDLSILNINKALELKEYLTSNDVLAQTYNTYGVMLDTKKEYRNAFEKYQKAYEIWDKAGNKKGVASTLFNMAFSLNKYGDPKEVEKMYERAYKIELEIDNKLGQAISESYFGDFYTKTNQLNKAEKFLHLAEDKLVNLGSLENLMNNHLYMANLYTAKNDYKSANTYYQKYLTFKDSVFNQQTTTQLAELEARYDLKEKQREIDVLSLQQSHNQQELDLNQKTIAQQRLIIIISIIGGGLLVISLVVSYKLSRTRAKANAQLRNLNLEISEYNRQITNQKEELEAQTENLNSANLELATQRENYKKSYESIKLLSEIGTNLTSSLSFETIIERVYTHVKSIVPADSVYFGYYDKYNNSLEFPGSIEKGVRSPYFSYDLVKDANSLSVTCFKKKEVIVINDLEKEFPQYHNPRPIDAPKSAVIVPLMKNKDVFGVLAINSYQSHQYNQYHIHLIENIGIYLSVAVQNAQNFNQLEKKLRENEMLYKLSGNLIAPIDLEHLLKNIIDTAVDLVPKAQTGSIFLLNEKGNYLEGKVSHRLEFNQINQVRFKIGEGYAGEAVAEEKNILDNEVKDDLLFNMDKLKSGRNPLKSIVVVLLKTTDKVIGTISIDNYDQFDAFNEQDMVILQSLAATASVAIDRMRMTEEIEQQIDIITKSEEKLRQNELKLKSAFRIARMASWEIDMVTKELVLNPEFCDIIGIPFNPKSNRLHINDYLYNYVHDDDRNKIAVAYKNIFLGKDQFSSPIQYKLIKPNGDIIWAMGSVGGSAKGGKQIKSVFGLFQDITEQKKVELSLYNIARELESKAESLEKANQELKELDQYKESMTAMIVHDFKNALNTVISFSDGQPTERRLRSIRQAGQFMLNMVLNILDVQKFESAKPKLAYANTSVNKLIIKAIEQLNYMIEQKSIKLTFNQNNQLEVRVDEDLVTRVIINILSNAIKFVPTNGKITIYVEKEDKHAKISIEDNGPGIPADKLHFVFDKYTQINAKSSGNIRSTGIGLTFCKMVVEAHEGTIDVHSTIGEGSTFYFTLPLLKDEFIVKPVQQVVVNNEIDIKLTKADIDKLRPWMNQLKQWEVYDYSEINEIISKISDSNKNIAFWKECLKEIIHNGNEEKYKQLINYK